MLFVPQLLRLSRWCTIIPGNALSLHYHIIMTKKLELTIAWLFMNGLGAKFWLRFEAQRDAHGHLLPLVFLFLSCFCSNPVSVSIFSFAPFPPHWSCLFRYQFPLKWCYFCFSLWYLIGPKLYFVAHAWSITITSTSGFAWRYCAWGRFKLKYGYIWASPWIRAGRYVRG